MQESTKQSLEKIPLWDLKAGGSKIERTLVFKDFKNCIEFMCKVGDEAENLNHHPDWYNSYNKLVICLTTHDKKQLTSKDFELARFIDTLALTYNL